MSGGWWVGQDELDEDQRDVMALDADTSALISGPPGSGKTNLLLLRANYLYLYGDTNLMVLTFTRSLTQFIASGAHQYDFPPSKITTSRAWGLKFLRGYGKSVVLSGKFEDDRALLADEIQAVIEENELANVYDAIMLDEAQDYLPREIDTFARLTPKLFCAADRKQKIYSGKESTKSILRHVDREITLRFHYRNGTQICRVADGLGRGFKGYSSLVETSQYNERENPSSVDRRRCVNLDEMAAVIVERVKTQISAFPGQLIGVICPKNTTLDALAERIRATELAASAVLLRDGSEEAFTPDKPLVLSTIHAAKGLEFRALHLAGCEHLDRFPLGPSLAFTAVTRAKTSLSVYHVEDLPGYLEGSLELLRPPKKRPTMDQVFGRKE